MVSQNSSDAARHAVAPEPPRSTDLRAEPLAASSAFVWGVSALMLLARESLLPYLIAAVLVFPSVIWIALDTSAWGGDQSQYGFATLELFHTLTPRAARVAGSNARRLYLQAERLDLARPGVSASRISDHLLRAEIRTKLPQAIADAIDHPRLQDLLEERAPCGRGFE